MKIIAESGATKTAWRAVEDDGTVRSAHSAGLSPTCLDSELTRDIIRSVMPVLNPYGRMVDEIFFYGAGFVSEASAVPVSASLEDWCPFARMYFHSDLLAAARALFGDGSGVAAIMGTGSNSCLYENGKIIGNIRPGGYILGDEGSGVSLGKAFLADFVKDLLPGQVAADFVGEFGLDYPEIVRKVYKEPAASAFMASLAPFILSKADDPYVRSLVEADLEAFVRRALVRYGRGHEVGVTGSFGCACRKFLEPIGESFGLHFSEFLPSPIDRLVTYHI